MIRIVAVRVNIDERMEKRTTRENYSQVMIIVISVAKVGTRVAQRVGC